MSAVLEHSLESDCSPPHAFCLPQLTQSLLPSDLSDFCPLPIAKLTSLQCADPCLGQVLYFVEHRRCLSRREHPREPDEALQLLQHWEQLSIKAGVLYRTG